MALTNTEQRIWEYIRAAYPQGIRSDAWDSGTVTESYDQERAILFAALETAIEAGVSRLSLQTCDATGITEWETFLGISINPLLPLTQRRAQVLSKLIGSHSTITNIRTVIESYLGTDASGYIITEKWKISSNVDDVWTYIVSVYSKPVGYDETVMRNLLEYIQPLHCVLELETTPTILDAI